MRTQAINARYIREDLFVIRIGETKLVMILNVIQIKIPSTGFKPMLVLKEMIFRVNQKINKTHQLEMYATYLVFTQKPFHNFSVFCLASTRCMISRRMTAAMKNKRVYLLIFYLVDTSDVFSTNGRSFVISDNE